jgi:hypothetical protein
MTAKVLMVAFVARDWGQIGSDISAKTEILPASPPYLRRHQDRRWWFRPEGCRGTGRRKTNPEGADGKDWKPSGTNPVAFD